MADTTETQESVQETANATETSTETSEEQDFLAKVGESMFDEEPSDDDSEETEVEEANAEATKEEVYEEKVETDTTTEPKTEVQHTEESETAQPAEQDEFASLRDAGYKAENIHALIDIVQSNPEVQAALRKAAQGGQVQETVQEQPAEEMKEKTLQDFMPNGKKYSSVDVLVEGTDSFEAYMAYTRYQASQELDKRSADQVKAQQQEMARQRQSELLQRGRENLKKNYNVTDEQLQSFGNRLQATRDVSPLEVAYLGMNFEALVEARVKEAVEREADKRAEEILRTKHNGKIPSAASAETGIAPGGRKDPLDGVNAIADSMFE
jgi:hypothetical protein